jgi:hypothetical protein
MNNNIVIDRGNTKVLHINPEEQNSNVFIERNRHNNTNEEKEDSHSELGLEFIMNKDAQEMANKAESDIQEEVSVPDNYSDNSNNNRGIFNDYPEEEHDIPYSGMSYEEIEQEKSIYLSKLNRLLSNPNIQGRRLTISNSLQEIKSEVIRIQKDIEITTGINYSRNGLMFCINTIEMLSKNYIDTLDGWSNVMMTDINNNSYDQVLEELYEKYSKHISMGPEIKLISMIAGSAFMFSLQKSLVDRSLNNPSLFDSIINKFTPKTQPKNEPQENNMSGPSFNADDLDDISSVSSIEITPPKRKPRRKKKE